MKENKYYIRVLRLFIIIAVNLTAFSFFSYGQECGDYLKTENCIIENTIKFKLSSLSRKNNIKTTSKVTYEVVMYGGNEIIIKCCTDNDFYPVRFKLRSSENGHIIYDNKYNNYLDNLNLQLDHTELIAIEISVEPRIKILKKNKMVCIGMAIYMEKDKTKY